jgi:tetratricopeptide (TPR) repeat protein
MGSGTGDYDEAISHYTAGIAFMPSEVLGYQKRANCHLQYQQYDLAVVDLKKVIEIATNKPEIDNEIVQE